VCSGLVDDPSGRIRGVTTDNLRGECCNGPNVDGSILPCARSIRNTAEPKSIFDRGNEFGGLSGILCAKGTSNCFPPDPETATLVAENRPPAPGANHCSVAPPGKSYGSGAGDQKDTGSGSDGAHVGNEGVGFNKNLGLRQQGYKATAVELNAFRATAAGKPTTHDVRKRGRVGKPSRNRSREHRLAVAAAERRRHVQHRPVTTPVISPLLPPVPWSFRLPVPRPARSSADGALTRAIETAAGR